MVLNMSAVEAQIKRLYKESVECVAYLDQSSKDTDDSNNLFSQRTITVRNRLCEYCEKIIFLKPLIYGKKAEETIWRKCFYEPIYRVRRNAKILSENDQCFYQMHLISAAGYYSTLMVKLQQEFQLDLHHSVDISCKRLPWNEKANTGSANDKGDPKKLHEFALLLSHKISVYLGDLSRYRQEFEKSTDSRLAQHYYHLALKLKPFHGQPHNQLGTLFAGRNFGLDAALSYMRCIYSAESFMGADGNLAQLLDRNATFYKELLIKYVDDVTDEAETTKQNLLTGYLFLFKLFFDDSESNLTSEDASQALENVRKSFCDFINLSSTDSDEDNNSCILKIFACQMMIIKKLQDKSSTKCQAALSFLLTLIQICSDHFLTFFALESINETEFGENDIHQENQSLNGNDAKYDSKQEPVVLENGNSLKDFTKNNGKAKKSAITSLLRRRKISRERNDSDESSSDEDVVELDDGSDSCDESEKNKILSTSSSQNSGEEKMSIIDENVDTIVETVVSEESHEIDGNDGGGKIVDTQIDLFTKHAELTICFKIITDWLRCNPTVTQAIHGVSATFWPKFIKMLNAMPNEDMIKAHIESTKSELNFLDNPDWSLLQKWEQKRPLPEDIYLRGVTYLTQIHSCIDFESYDENLSVKSQTIVRIFCIRSFGHVLANLNVADVRYDVLNMIFTSKMVKDDQKKNYHQKFNEDLSNKERLMRNMAKLRLKDEMRSVEQVLWIPVYLVPDSSCLSLSLRHVQRLLACRRFVLVVPMAAVSALDGAKKSSAKAREASRWLESRLNDGHKFIRSQKEGESVSKENSILIENSRNVDAQHKEICGVMDCSAYLTHAAPSSGSTVVCILTDDYKPRYAKVDEEDVQEKALTQLYKESIAATDLKSVSVDNVRHFCNRWFEYQNAGSGGRGRKRDIR